MANLLRLILVLFSTFAIGELVSEKPIHRSLSVQEDHAPKPNRLASPKSSTVRARKLEEEVANQDDGGMYSNSTQAPDGATDDEIPTDDTAEAEGTDGEGQGDETSDSPQSDGTDGFDDRENDVSFGITDMYNTPPGNWDAFDWFVAASVLAAWGFICIWVWSVIQQCRRWCCPKKTSFDDTKVDLSSLSSYYSRHSKD